MKHYDITAEPMFKHLFGEFAESKRNPNYDTTHDEWKAKMKAEYIADMLATSLREDDEIERVMCENIDVVNSIIKRFPEVQEIINENVEHWLEMDATNHYEKKYE